MGKLVKSLIKFLFHEAFLNGLDIACTFAIDTKIVPSSIDTFLVASITGMESAFSALNLVKVRRLRVHRLPHVGLVSHSRLLLRLRTVAKAQGVRLRVAGGIHM